MGEGSLGGQVERKGGGSRPAGCCGRPAGGGRLVCGALDFIDEIDEILTARLGELLLHVLRRRDERLWSGRGRLHAALGRQPVAHFLGLADHRYSVWNSPASLAALQDGLALIIVKLRHEPVRSQQRREAGEVVQDRQIVARTRRTSSPG